MLYGRIHLVPYKTYMKCKDDVTGFTHVFLQSSLKSILRVRVKDEYFVIQCKEEKGKWVFIEKPSFKPRWIETEEEIKEMCVQQRNYLRITLYNYNFVKSHSLTHTLTAFRKQIHRQCRLELRIDYGYKFGLQNMNNIYICLIYQHEIVSNIELGFHVDYINSNKLNTIVIESFTPEIYEGRKYNILLRAIAILLGKYMYDSDTLVSIAANPISVWIMTQYFDAELTDDFKKYTKKHKLTFEHIEDYLEDKGTTRLIVPLQKKYLDKATRVYEDILSELKCP